MATVFEQIISGELPCDKVFENESFIAIKDRFPQAPVHILIIPKKHIARLHDVTYQDDGLIEEAFSIARHLADLLQISDGYRVVVNNGAGAGQTVFHLHFHLLGGKNLEHAFA